MLVVFAPALFAPTASAKDKPENSTRIYTHTYDEVFQASQETIERMGLFITDKDKDKGTISGNGKYRVLCGYGPCFMTLTFDIRLETVSTKPETRVTIDVKRQASAFNPRGQSEVKNEFLSQLQKTLATYH